MGRFVRYHPETVTSKGLLKSTPIIWLVVIFNETYEWNESTAVSCKPVTIFCVITCHFSIHLEHGQQMSSILQNK
jgi:hypothetical protein